MARLTQIKWCLLDAKHCQKAKFTVNKYLPFVFFIILLLLLKRPPFDFFAIKLRFSRNILK